MPGFTLADVRGAVRKLIFDTGTTRVFSADSDFDDPYIRQALQGYSERKPRRRPFHTLQIQAGVGEYTLPDDWMRRDEESWQKAYGVPAKGFRYAPYPTVSRPQGASSPPGWMAPGGELEFVNDERMLYIHPVPAGTVTLTFSYLGLHVIDVADKTRTTIKATDQAVLEKLAAAEALEAIAIEQAFLTKYKLARGLEVDNSGVSDELRTSATNYRNEAYAQMAGPVMMRG